MSNQAIGSSGGTHSDQSLWRSRRGAGVIQWLLILPLFLVVVIGGYEVWKAVSIRESLRSGTYLATRYLSLRPETTDWSGVARTQFIWPELRNNGFIQHLVDQGRLGEGQVIISAVRPEPLECGTSFLISAEVPWQPLIPFSDFPSGPDADWTIGVEYRGYVICR